MEFFNLKQPRGAMKYPKYTAVYSRVYGRILRYWSLEYTAVYPKSPKWGSFKHNIDHHNWQTRGIPQLTYACIVHCILVATCTCHVLLSPKTPFFTCILPGIPSMPGYAHHKGGAGPPPWPPSTAWGRGWGPYPWGGGGGASSSTTTTSAPHFICLVGLPPLGAYNWTHAAVASHTDWGASYPPTWWMHPPPPLCSFCYTFLPVYSPDVSSMNLN